MSVATARKMHWSEEEYLAMEAESAIKHEFYDGDVFAMAGAKPHHNLIAGNTIVAYRWLRHG